SFSVLDVENLRLHYARTLQHWLQRYEDNVDAVREMYDEVFVRAWRLYLSGSIAAFTAGQLQLFQVVFTRPQNNKIPWSRKHLYMNNGTED
ncbi:MAG: class I SAM-dependent methyltransferase, partial [Gammaproteobacteria bacterium]